MYSTLWFKVVDKIGAEKSKKKNIEWEHLS